MDNPMVWLGLVAVLAAVAATVWAVVRPRPPALPGGDAPALPGPGDIFLAALGRTREALSGALGGVFAREKVDEGAFESLEEALIRADAGAKVAMGLVEELRRRVRKDAPMAELREALQGLLRERLEAVQGRGVGIAGPASGLQVILVVGVNGSGKTTTIGKLAARYQKAGRKVILGAGDTFRAGAIEQLKVWGERAGVEVIAAQEGADPASVLHDTLVAAKARGADVAILDTAGRLQAHKALMDELGKIRRVIGKVVEGAPHEVLLVLDGTMGQNAMSQARIFKDVAGVTGVVLTKLDGTAKGGMVVGIAEELKLPVKLVGVGEKVEDLRDFDAAAYVAGLFRAG